MINTDKIRGIFPILYTFFNKNNSIDYKLMEEQISLIFKKKCNGIAALGLATEVNKLTLKEKIKIIELISKITIFFLRSVIFNRSEINEYSELEMCFFSFETLNFSSTNKTRLELFFLFELFL